MNKIFTILLCAICISVPIFAIPADDSNIEAYRNEYFGKVIPYWEQNGQRGEFEGKEVVPIAYIKLLAAQEKGAIVILHGKGESSEKYAELVYDLHLKNPDFSFYLMDFRGHGRSGRLLGNRYKVQVENFEYYLEDVKKFIAQFKLNNGIK